MRYTKAQIVSYLKGHTDAAPLSWIINNIEHGDNLEKWTEINRKIIMKKKRTNENLFGIKGWRASWLLVALWFVIGLMVGGIATLVITN